MAEGDISTSEAARRLLMSRTTLIRRIKRLKIKTQKIGPSHVLSAEQFRQLVEDDARGSCGRPLDLRAKVAAQN